MISTGSLRYFAYFHTLNVSITKLVFRFRDISVKMPGSCHDATALRESGLFKSCKQLPDVRWPVSQLLSHSCKYSEIKLFVLLQNPVNIEGTEIPLVALGDPAYPLLPWLIKPYVGGNLSAEKESFNCYHSSARIYVENAFGRLKARWRITCKKIEANISFAPQIIAACCILHNLCEDASMCDPICSPVSSPNCIQPQSPINNQSSVTGHRIRDALLVYVTNNLPQRKSCVF